MKRRDLIHSFTAMLLALCMASNFAIAGADSDKLDAKAIEILKQMDAYTDSLDKFVIKAESYLDAGIDDGQIISNASETQVSVDRSGSMHSRSRRGSQTDEIYFHKGTLTVYSGKHEFYSSSRVPEALDAGLMFALDELGVETPLMDLMIVNSLDHLLTSDMGVVYITGSASIRGVECHHILLSGPLVDFQVWISKGDKPVPRRTLMTYKNVQGLPRNEVFLEWSEVDSFNKSEFKFEPPEDAQEIDFIDAP